MEENENPFIKHFLKSPTEQMNYLFQIMKVLKCSILTLINNLGEIEILAVLLIQWVHPRCQAVSLIMHF